MIRHSQMIKLDMIGVIILPLLIGSIVGYYSDGKNQGQIIFSGIIVNVFSWLIIQILEVTYQYIQIIIMMILFCIAFYLGRRYRQDRDEWEPDFAIWQ